MSLTAPQFAWACADAGDYPPPTPKRGDRYGPDALCALCGGATDGVGWPRKLGLPDTFTDIPFMVTPASQTLCQSCVATARSEGWAQYVAAHPERGLRAAFDQLESAPSDYAARSRRAASSDFSASVRASLQVSDT